SPTLLAGRRRLLPSALPASSRWIRSNFHPPCSWELAAQAELLDEGAVALEVVLLHVVQEATATTDELEQPAPRIVVVLVGAQMLRQLVDPLCEHRDLHLRRAGVGLAAAVLRDDLLLCFLGQGQNALSFLVADTRGSAHSAASFAEGDVARAGPGSRGRVAETGMATAIPQERLAEILRDARARSGVPAVTAGLLVGERVELAADGPVEIETPFRIASITKWFTASLAALLLDLDAPSSPGAVSAGRLLSHTADLRPNSRELLPEACRGLWSYSNA